MLKLITDTGTFEATAEDERRVRSLSDIQVCRHLNSCQTLDPFVIAALRERPQIVPSPAGWTVQA